MSRRLISVIPITLLTIVYAIVAFFNLGDREAPATFWMPRFEDAAVIDLGETVEQATIWFYNGATHEQNFIVSFSMDGENFDMPIFLHSDAVFRWHDRWIGPGDSFRYVKITSDAFELMLMEVAFFDNFGRQLQIASGVPELADEQGLVPERQTFMNSTYFDEIFHARTAFEIIHNMSIFETSHPPLGKVLMALGVQIFGMNPFGWRFMGTLAGVIMVPLIFFFAKRMFGSPLIAFFVAFIFTFDFMHFVQTRLATIDSYVVLFIIPAYYFMYKFYKGDKNTLRNLFFSGLFMGLSIASKWTGIYAAAGLAVIFAITMWRQYKGTRKKRDFNKYFKYIVGYCFIFFAAVPLVIYVASYIPQYRHMGFGEFFRAVWDNQRWMFEYHAWLYAEHPYSSRWWEWPIMTLPIWYYAGRTADGLREGISAFGNPIVWWSGILAFVYTVVKYIRTKDRAALFLIIGYLAQFAPWIFVTRILFIYHYFTAVPFVVLMLGMAAKDFMEHNKKAGIASVYAFMAVAAGLFVLFYPVLAGAPVSFEFVDRWLRWLPGWVLV